MSPKRAIYAVFLSIYLSSLSATEWLPEAKAGYFVPTGHRLRKIYGGGGIYSLEVSAQAWRGLYPWANVSYFTQSGHSSGLKNRTTINLVPFQLGLKYLFDITSDSRIYLGLGMTPTYLNTQDHSSHVIHSVHKWGIGGVVKTGAYVNFKNFFLDFFMDYSFTEIGFHGMHHHPRVYRNDADVSGFTFGAGIGYRFGAPKQPRKTKTSQDEYSKPTMLPENVPQEQSYAEPNTESSDSITEDVTLIDPIGIEKTEENH